MSKTTSSNSTWDSIEKWVSLAGKFSWILIILQIVVMLIITLVNLGKIDEFLELMNDLPETDMFYIVYNQARTSLIIGVIWQFISMAVIIVITIIFVRPFAIKCGEKDWNFLINDVIVISGYRIPKMLILGILAELFANGWGGLWILIPALLIIFMGPEKMEWK